MDGPHRQNPSHVQRRTASSQAAGRDPLRHGQVRARPHPRGAQRQRYRDDHDQGQAGKAAAGSAPTIPEGDSSSRREGVQGRGREGASSMSPRPSADSVCRSISGAPSSSGACGTRCARFRSARPPRTRGSPTQIGAPKAIRAVAGSCSKSLFAFAVPCHRVLHKGGASAAGRRDGRQYRWVAYEAKLNAKRLKRSG